MAPLAFASLTLIQASGDQKELTGYGPFSFGMTLAEAKHIATLHGPNLGRQSYLLTDPTTINGLSYTFNLDFKADRLNMITLIARAKASEKPCPALHEQTVSSLAKEYGKAEPGELRASSNDRDSTIKYNVSDIYMSKGTSVEIITSAKSEYCIDVIRFHASA